MFQTHSYPPNQKLASSDHKKIRTVPTSLVSLVGISLQIYLLLETKSSRDHAVGYLWYVWHSLAWRPAVIPLGAPLGEREEEASCRLRWIVQNPRSESFKDLFW